MGHHFFHIPLFSEVLFSVLHHSYKNKKESRWYNFLYPKPAQKERVTLKL
jgi:hypothetical protein